MAGRSSSSGPTPEDHDWPEPPSTDSDWPRVTVELRADGVGILNGRQIHAADGEQIRALLIHLVIDMAAVGKTPVIAQVLEPAGTWELLVRPDGTVTDLTQNQARNDLARNDLTRNDVAATSARRPVKTPKGQWYIGPVGSAPSAEAVPSAGAGDVAVDDMAVGDVAVGDVAVGDVAVDDVADDAAMADDSRALMMRRPGQLTVRTVRLATGSAAVLPVLQAPDDDADAAQRQSVAATTPAGRPPAPTPHRPAVDPYPDGEDLVDLRIWGVRGKSAGRALQTAALGVVAVVVIAGVTALVIDRGRDTRPEIAVSARPSTSATRAPAPSEPDPVPASAPTPATFRPARLAAAPVGFAADPTWGLSIDAKTKVAAGARGAVYTRTPEGALVGVDSATGAIIWTAPGAWDSGWDGPWTSRIDGRDVVALVGAEQVVYWQQPSGPLPAGRQADRPATVTVPAGSRVTWAGPSPLIAPPAGGAAVIRGGRVQAVPLPAGARPLAADDDAVIAVQGGQWIRGKIGRTPTVRTIPAPRGLSGPPVRVEAVGAQFLVAIWPKPAKGGQSYVLLETQSGRLLVQDTMHPSLDATHGGVVRQLGGTLTAVGPLVIDTDSHLVHVLLAEYRVSAVTSGHVIATTGSEITDIGLTVNRGFTVKPYPNGYPAENAPFAAIRGAKSRTGLALIEEPNRWVLVALPGR